MFVLQNILILSYHNLFTKTIIHTIISSYYILFRIHKHSLTTIFCLLFTLIFSNSVSSFSIDRRAFSSRIKSSFIRLHCPCSRVACSIKKLMTKTTLEIIRITCPYNHTAIFRYHNFTVRQLLPSYSDFFQFFP